MANVKPAFFERLEMDFAQYFGPMAPVIIDEKCEELGYARNEFPQQHLSQLIEKMSNELTDRNQRTQFRDRAQTLMKEF
ncbi:MAG: hypothetical protein JSU81_04515 [Candidatus Coatesbacteria bacterium]|nr:MAG: hypothetical protein JSU81_04515 [Candidatus Coatesbacteria bacterium]